ncbi:NB-ARC domains-containing protein [Tanacetum coccineum]
MKLRYCCNLTTTPDFTEITNLEELSLEGCVNLLSVHSSIGMLNRLVVLNLRDCKRLQNFPSRVKMDALQVLNLSGCLRVDQLPEALGQIKSLTELHVDTTAITKLPSFVSSLINLESVSFGGQGRIQRRWWTSITSTFGLLSKHQHPQRSLSFAGLQNLKDLNLSYCNLEQVPESIGGLSCLEILDLEGNNLLEVPESIGGLSCLERLYLEGNNFTSLPGSLSELSHLDILDLSRCKKLEVLAELPPTLTQIIAIDCTSLREVSGSSKNPFRIINDFGNCPKLFKKTQCLDSSITSQGFFQQLSAFLGFSGFQTNKCEFYCSPGSAFDTLRMVYHGNSIPEWFTVRSTENHLKVELASDWCYDKFRGFGTCVVFKCKKPRKFKGYSVKNFDGASLFTVEYYPYVWKESYMIWLHYTLDTWKWNEAMNFVTFCLEENNEDVEVKEFGVRLICDEDLQQETDLSMLHGGHQTTRKRGRCIEKRWRTKKGREIPNKVF